MSKRLLFCVVMVVPVWIAVAIAQDARSTEAKKTSSATSQPATSQSSPKALELRVMVALGKTGPTLVLEATNVSDRPITVIPFGNSGNQLIVTLPQGRDVRTGLPSSVQYKWDTIAAGQSKQWLYQFGEVLWDAPGSYKCHWEITAKDSKDKDEERISSEELLLYRIPVKGREAEAAANRPDRKTHK
jgi:hypothetical protein